MFLRRPFINQWVMSRRVATFCKHIEQFQINWSICTCLFSPFISDNSSGTHLNCFAQRTYNKACSVPGAGELKTFAWQIHIKRSMWISFLTWVRSRKAMLFFFSPTLPGEWEGYRNVPPLEENMVHIFPPLYLTYRELFCISLPRESFDIMSSVAAWLKCGIKLCSQCNLQNLSEPIQVWMPNLYSQLSYQSTSQS